MNSTNSLIHLKWIKSTFLPCLMSNDTNDGFYLISWQWLGRWWGMKVVMLKFSLFFLHHPAAVYQGDDDSAIYRQQSRCWWRVLSVFTNPGLWIHNAEHALSPPQTPFFVSLLRLNLIANFFFCCCRLCRLVVAITAPFFLSQMLTCPLPPRLCPTASFFISLPPPHYV